MTSTMLWQEIRAGRLAVERVNGIQRVSWYEELPGTRAEEGLQALYAFNAGEGAMLHNGSGAAMPLAPQVESGAAVSWIAGSGLSLQKPAVISSDGPAKKVIETVIASDEITIEARVKPMGTFPASAGQIATLSPDANMHNVSLSQGRGKSQAANVHGIHLGTEFTDQNGLPPLTTPGATHVVYTRDRSGVARIYVNGSVVAQVTLSASLANWNGSYRLILAKELTQDGPLPGEYYLVAIYSRALTYKEVLRNFRVGSGDTALQPVSVTDYAATSPWDTAPSAMPAADFTAEPLSGPVPLTVQFSDQSTGDITSWAWDFKNNGTIDSTEQNPSRTYGRPGMKSVRLTVTGPEGSSTIVKKDYITVEEPPPGAPVADFTAEPLSGPVPLTVQFSDLSTGDITSWAWDFKNNGTIDSTEQNPSRTYGRTGTKSVRLTVTGPEGSSTIVKKDYITVEEPPPGAPVADFTAEPLSGPAPLTVQFSDQSTGDITSWAWDFKNNGSIDSTEQNPSRTYTRPGTKSVRLVVTGPEGSSTTVKKDYVTVEEPLPPAPVADFTAEPLSGPVPLTVQFSDLSTGDITSWAWDFDNNGSIDSTEQNPSHTYSNAGTYSVKLTVTGPGGSSTSVQENYITVEASPPDESAYYVATNGNDSWDGKSPTYGGGVTGPWRTLAKAASMVAPGDTVYIRGGIYQEASSWNTDGTEANPITITNYNGETVIIDGDNNSIPAKAAMDALLKLNGDWYTVSNLEVRYSGGYGIVPWGDHVTLYKDYVHHCWRTGITMQGSYCVTDTCYAYYNSMNNEGWTMPGGWGVGISSSHNDPGYCIIRNCMAWDNWGEGISTFESYHVTIEDNISYNNGLGYYLSDCRYAVLQRNLAYFTPGNQSEGHNQHCIQMGNEGAFPSCSDNTIINNLSLGGERGIYIGSNTLENGLIAYNTIVNVLPTGDATVYFNGGTYSNALFKNNVILQEDTVLIGGVEASGIVFAYNNWSRTPPSSVQGTGDVVADPKIAKTGPTGPGELTADYFKLLSDSPAIDKALLLPEVIEDFFGNPRGASPDIGGHEF